MGGTKVPDPNDAAIAGANADARNMPFTYMVDALAKMGGKATIRGKTYDFSGLGDADNASVVSDKTAQALLDIQKNYGSQYVKQRLDELKQADPTGYADRQQLFDKIMADSQANPNRPLADETQQQIMSLLQKGGKLSEGPNSQTEQVQQSVRGGQIARGNYLGNAAASQEANAVEGAGEQKRNDRQQQAIAFQSSGVSPEDVTYRRLQQSLSNLGAFVSGANPTAEFSSLSSAGNGAVPFAGGPGVSAATDPNAALFGQQNAATGYAGNVNFSNHQVNPFLAGISGALQGGQMAVNLGWKPFGSSSGGGYNAGYSNFQSPGFAPMYSPTPYGAGGSPAPWAGFDAPSATVTNTA